jgi:hypothetical protein
VSAHARTLTPPPPFNIHVVVQEVCIITNLGKFNIIYHKNLLYCKVIAIAPHVKKNKKIVHPRGGGHCQLFNLLPEKLEEYSSPRYMPEGLGRKP